VWTFSGEREAQVVARVPPSIPVREKTPRFFSTGTTISMKFGCHGGVRAEDEAVAGLGLEPVLQLVGDPLGAADEVGARAGDALGGLQQVRLWVLA